MILCILAELQEIKHEYRNNMQKKSLFIFFENAKLIKNLNGEKLKGVKNG